MRKRKRSSHEITMNKDTTQVKWRVWGGGCCCCMWVSLSSGEISFFFLSTSGCRNQRRKKKFVVYNLFMSAQLQPSGLWPIHAHHHHRPTIATTTSLERIFIDTHFSTCFFFFFFIQLIYPDSFIFGVSNGPARRIESCWACATSHEESLEPDDGTNRK